MACAWLPIACAQHSLGIGFLRAGFGHVLRGRCSVRDVLGIGFQSARSSHTSKAARVRAGCWGRGRTGVAGDGRTAGGWVAHTQRCVGVVMKGPFAGTLGPMTYLWCHSIRAALYCPRERHDCLPYLWSRAPTTRTR